MKEKCPKCGKRSLVIEFHPLKIWSRCENCCDVRKLVDLSRQEIKELV